MNNAWRDVDHGQLKFGLVFWRTGGQISLGHRLYRWRFPWSPFWR